MRSNATFTFLLTLPTLCFAREVRAEPPSAPAVTPSAPVPSPSPTGGAATAPSASSGAPSAPPPAVPSSATAPSAPAPPVAAPVAAPPAPARATLDPEHSFVHLGSSYPGAWLELKSSVDETDWRRVCAAPCDQSLLVAGQLARVSAPRMTTSNAFRIEPGQGTALVRVD